MKGITGLIGAMAEAIATPNADERIIDELKPKKEILGISHSS